ncbi:MAG: hypothetical protein PHH26_06660 [Candidatus Thermoplasmatota archaeon]|nr:hypothetical protein [Candidatus Thermoplasmatota archaeon]
MRFGGFAIALVLFFALSAAAQTGIGVLRTYHGSEGTFNLKEAIEISGNTSFSASLFQSERQAETITIANHARSEMEGADFHLEAELTVFFNSGSGEEIQQLIPSYVNQSANQSRPEYYSVKSMAYEIGNTGAVISLKPKNNLQDDKDRNCNGFMELKISPQKTRHLEVMLQAAKNSPAGEYRVKIKFLLLDI